jgi:hypothetical protein
MDRVATPSSLSGKRYGSAGNIECLCKYLMPSLLALLQVFDLTAVYMASLRKDPFLPYSANPSESADEQKARRDQYTMQSQSTCKQKAARLLVQMLILRFSGSLVALQSFACGKG